MRWNQQNLQGLNKAISDKYKLPKVAIVTKTKDNSKAYLLTKLVNFWAQAFLGIKIAAINTTAKTFKTMFPKDKNQIR